ncbi:MAG: AAA family ATPase [Clostridia bacterium]|nr:AAA family ATPase [Clostridia bacterium]
MENLEKKYFAKTLQILDKKINENKQAKSEIDEKLMKDKKYLSENYRDADKGGDLSTFFSTLGTLQARSEELYREGKRLKTQYSSPYFARIDFKPDGKEKPTQVYIGLGTVIDGKKLVVADWRAPISCMYYDYELGRASFKIGNDKIDGEMTLKRQYKIDDGQLLSYFDTDMTINDEILQEILSKNVSIKMKQIVSSIQKEQNAIVRNDLGQNMLVQGIAGSGKTSIALHRAAYLLYSHRKLIKSNDICILSPNNVFSSYISEVLPQLGEDNLAETTLERIVRSELKLPVQAREDMLDEIASNPDQELLNEISYKSSYEYLDGLLRFLKGPFIETFQPKTLSFVVAENMEGEKETIDFPAEQTKDLFFKTHKGLDLYERINKIAWQYAMFFTERRHYSKEQNRGLKERFKRILYNFLPIKEVEKVYQIFMAREGLKPSTGKTIKYMDKGTYLAIKHYLYGIDHDFTAKYLIIDEMQDFTPVDIYVFKKIWNCPMIVVGDVHQCIEKNVTDEYLRLTADFLGCKLIELNKTYRSTKEIALYANHLVGLENIEFVNRSGGEPIVIKTQNQAEAIKEYIESQCERFEHIAIICKCKKEAKEMYKNLSKIVDCKILAEPEDYQHRILITTCATAKGIEFDAVIIPNADNENYRNTIDKNIIYVSATRALHKLCFVTDKTPSLFTKSLQIIDKN